MGVVSCIPKWSNRPARGNWDSRSIVATYDILTDDAKMDAYAVDQDAKLPKPGDTYASDQYCRVTDKQIEPDGPMHWVATLTYSFFSPQSGAVPGQDDNPTTFPPEINWDAVGATEEIDKDAHGKAIANKLKDRYYGLKDDFYDQVLRVTRNEATFNAPLACSYFTIPTCNQDKFLGAEPGTVKCGPIRANLMFWRGFHYWRVSYEFHWRWDGWRRKVLCEGMHCYEGLRKVPVKTVKMGSIQSQTPQRLDKDTGEQLEIGDPDQFEEFDVCVSRPFAVFNIVVPA